MPFLNEKLLWVIAATFLALAVGSMVRLIASRRMDPAVRQDRMGSLKVWWLLALLWSAAALLGLPGCLLLLAIASYLAWREYLQLLDPDRGLGGALTVGSWVLFLVHYGLMGWGPLPWALGWLPVGGLVLVGGIRATAAWPSQYVRLTGGWFWGALLMFYAPSFALLLFRQDSGVESSLGRSGPFLFVVLLTEWNDIAQALVGRRWGKRKVVPRISPNKSWEGLWGGIVCTMVLSVILAPWLTQLSPSPLGLSGLVAAAGAGLLISLSGFLGDLNMSGIKRDAGVKDGSRLLPGMGGAMDRLDSLTFSAPMFYVYYHFWMN